MNEACLRGAELGDGEIIIILHGIFTNYYSAVYWAAKWFKHSGVNVVSIGYDYRADLKTSAMEVKRQIDQILTRPGIKNVNMIGISLGGQVARYYVEMLGGKSVINRLVTIFSPLRAPREGDFSIAKFMDQFSGNKEITKRSMEQTIEMEEKFSVDHLALHGTRDLIVSKLALPIHETKDVIFIPVPGGHTLVSYNTIAMEYAHMFILYGKGAIHVPE